MNTKSLLNRTKNVVNYLKTAMNVRASIFNTNFLADATTVIKSSFQILQNKAMESVHFKIHDDLVANTARADTEFTPIIAKGI